MGVVVFVYISSAVVGRERMITGTYDHKLSSRFSERSCPRE